LPLCNSTSRIITRLVMIRMIETPMTIAARSFFPVQLLVGPGQLAVTPAVS
jgi:hypothetical protein